MAKLPCEKFANSTFIQAEFRSSAVFIIKKYLFETL